MSEPRDYLAEAYAILRGVTMLLPQVEHLRAIEDSRRQILNKYITSLDEQIAQLKKWSGQ